MGRETSVVVWPHQKSGPKKKDTKIANCGQIGKRGHPRSSCRDEVDGAMEGRGLEERKETAIKIWCKTATAVDII